MSTLADFKRAMIVGSRWKTEHVYIDDYGVETSAIKDMGEREVGKVQSNSFAFISPQTGNLSWCDWPKKAELYFDGDKAIITTAGFCKLTYIRA